MYQHLLTYGHIPSNALQDGFIDFIQFYYFQPVKLCHLSLAKIHNHSNHLRALDHTKCCPSTNQATYSDEYCI